MRVSRILWSRKYFLSRNFSREIIAITTARNKIARPKTPTFSSIPSLGIIVSLALDKMNFFISSLGSALSSRVPLKPSMTIKTLAG
jgi:hypothetical protein